MARFVQQNTSNLEWARDDADNCVFNLEEDGAEPELLKEAKALQEKLQIRLEEKMAADRRPQEKGAV